MLFSVYIPCVFLVAAVHGTSVKVQGLPVCVPFPVYIPCVFLIAPVLRTSVKVQGLPVCVLFPVYMILPVYF